MNTLFMHCRPGFEGEVCAEISEHAARLGIAGYAKGKPHSASAEFVCTEEGGAERLMGSLRFNELIFPRQWARGGYVELPETDRISVLLAELADLPVLGSLWLEVLDSNEGKELSTFAASSKCRCARRWRRPAAWLTTPAAHACCSPSSAAGGCSPVLRRPTTVPCGPWAFRA